MTEAGRYVATEVNNNSMKTNRIKTINSTTQHCTFTGDQKGRFYTRKVTLNISSQKIKYNNMKCLTNVELILQNIFQAKKIYIFFIGSSNELPYEIDY